ncbi:MAG: toll/interleukin-1 receptor domain-containing protein [Pseudomonadota bacterium]
MGEDTQPAAMASGANIFISYNRQDRDFRYQLEGLLLEEGYNPDFDEEGIASGEEWKARLKEMIGECDTFIVIFTAAWTESINCRIEFDIAETLGKRILPVLPHDLAPASAPNEDEIRVRSALMKKNFVTFFPQREGDGGGFYRGTKKLIAFLRDDIDQLRLRRVYESKARLWKTQDEDLLFSDQLSQAEAWMVKEKQSKGVSLEIEAYITASQAARKAAQFRNLRNRLILGALSAMAIITIAGAVFVASVAVQSVFTAEEKLALADQDSEDLSEAARLWADGKVALETARTTVIDSGKLNTAQLQSLQRDFYIDRANETFDKSLAAISKIDRDSVRGLHFDIGLDRSTAYLVDGEPSKSREMLENLDDIRSFASTQSKATQLMGLAYLACDEAGGGPTAKQAALIILETAEDPVRDAYRSEPFNRWRSGVTPCEGAEAALREISGADDRNVVEAIPDPIVSQAPPIDSDFAIEDIYVHIAAEEDRPAARDLAQALAENGYSVLGIELIEAAPGRNRSIRYYYSVQEPVAEYLRALCADLSAESTSNAGWADPETYRVISLEGRYKNLPRNRIEIWL